MPPNLAWSVLERRLHIANDCPVERECAAAARPVVGGDRRYVGSSSRHLQRLANINAAGPGDRATERERRMIPSLGAITMAHSSGSASYHGLETTVEKRLSHGVQGSLWYTWSHSIDDVTGSRPGPKAIWSSRTGATSAAIAGTRASTGAIAWWPTHSSSCRLASDDAGVAAGASSARCSATGRCPRSCRCSRAPGSMWRFSTRRTAWASRRAAACGGLISSAIRACHVRPPMRGSTRRRSQSRRPRTEPTPVPRPPSQFTGRPGIFQPGCCGHAGHAPRTYVAAATPVGGLQRDQPPVVPACRTPTSEALISAQSGRPWARRVRCSLA